MIARGIATGIEQFLAPSPAGFASIGLPAASADRTPNFRGIAVTADGTVAVAGLHQVIRLSS